MSPAKRRRVSLAARWRALGRRWTKARQARARRVREREADVRVRRAAAAEMAAARAARAERRQRERQARATARAARVQRERDRATQRAAARQAERQTMRTHQAAPARVVVPSATQPRTRAERIDRDRDQVPSLQGPTQRRAMIRADATACGIPTRDGTPCQRQVLPGTHDCGVDHHHRWGTVMSASDRATHRLRAAGYRGGIDQDGVPVDADAWTEWARASIAGETRD